MINERHSKPNQISKSGNINQKNPKAENKKQSEFKSFSERKIKVSSKNKQR
jgi:hypothetical protein